MSDRGHTACPSVTLKLDSQLPSPRSCLAFVHPTRGFFDDEVDDRLRPARSMVAQLPLMRAYEYRAKKLSTRLQASSRSAANSPEREKKP